jgi:hypothetical protein
MSVRTLQCRKCSQTIYETGVMVKKQDGTQFAQRFNEPQGINPHYLTCPARARNQEGGSGSGGSGGGGSAGGTTATSTKGPTVIDRQVASLAQEVDDIKASLRAAGIKLLGEAGKSTEKEWGF